MSKCTEESILCLPTAVVPPFKIFLDFHKRPMTFFGHRYDIAKMTKLRVISKSVATYNAWEVVKFKDDILTGPRVTIP